MKVFAITAILMAALAGCAGTYGGGYGFEPIRPTVYRNEFLVRIHIRTLKTIDAECLHQGVITVNALAGCTKFDEAANRLDMWVVEPRSVDDIEGFAVIGHELWHGARGKFHWH